MLNEEASLGRPPFRTVSHAVDFFDAKKGVASSAVFTEEPRVPDRDPKDSGSEFKPVGGPFYPSKAPRSGKQGTFTKFPEYLPVYPPHLPAPLIPLPVAHTSFNPLAQPSS